MSTTHTPGPWRTEYRTPKLYPDRDIVVLADGREIADVIGCDGMTTDNARLIAAAPKLLEACKNIEWIHIAFSDDDLICPCCWRTKDEGHKLDCQLQAALAAAEV